MSGETFKLAGLSLGFALIALSRSVGGEQPSAPVAKGATIAPLGAVDLGPEIEGMAGRQLRARKITLEPRGFYELHSHRDRLGVVYVLEGRITETRNGVVKEYKPGDSWLENKETNHSVENKGTTPVTFIAVDIFKTQ